VPEYLIHYEGSPLAVSPLMRMLRDEGVEVYVRHTSTESGVAEVAATIVVSIVASGAYDVIKAGVRSFRERYTDCSAEIDDEGYKPMYSAEQLDAIFAGMNEFMDRRRDQAEGDDRSADET
jgi:hypothetical protein